MLSRLIVLEHSQVRSLSGHQRVQDSCLPSHTCKVRQAQQTRWAWHAHMLHTTCMHAANYVHSRSCCFPDKRNTGARARKNYHQHPELVHVLAVRALRWRVAHYSLHLETQQSTVHTRTPRAMSMPVCKASTHPTADALFLHVHARTRRKQLRRTSRFRVSGLVVGYRVQEQTNSFSWRCKEAMPPEPSATLSSTRAACMRSLSCTLPAPSGLHG